MNIAGLVDPAGAGSTDRWVRSFNMDQLVSRKNRYMQHFDEVDWTILGWQDHRVLDGAGTHGKDTNRKDISNTGTIVGLVYFSLLIIFMLVYLT